MRDADSTIMARRFEAQLLTGPPGRTVAQVVTRLLAVQGQDPRGARLAVRARSTGLTSADVDRVLTDERSLLITWLNRGTLHLVAVDDYWWLHALTTPPLATGNARRLAQEGVTADDADRAVDAVDRALADEGPLTREELAERIARAGIRTQGQAIVHLLYRASARGVAVRGPVTGGKHAYARVDDWLGTRPARFAPAKFDRDVALAELARRYLAGHGPASEQDLAKWAGLPLRDARRGLAAIAGQLRQRDDGLADLAADHVGVGADQLPAPRLLGAFDPLLLGWVAREPVLGPHKGVITMNGVFRPFALAGGRAVATWGLTRSRVELAPFDPLGESVTRALATDAADVIRFLNPCGDRSQRSPSPTARGEGPGLAGAAGRDVPAP